MTKRAVENVVKILKENEGLLSDGYKFYCDEDKVDKILKEIAIDIIKELNKVIYEGKINVQ